MSKKRNMIATNIGDKCLSFDMYGRQVMLTFQGHDKLKTKFGAICTIIIGLVVLSYAAFKATELFNLKHALPVRSKIFSESLYEIYGGEIDNIKIRDGSMIDLGEFSDPVQP